MIKKIGVMLLILVPLIGCAYIKGQKVLNAKPEKCICKCNNQECICKCK